MSQNNNLNQKVIIQGIDQEKMKLSIGGEIQEIQHQLSDLLKILQAQNIQTVQYAEKIYNIENINEANFGFVTGKQAFNETITKKILEHIQKYATSNIQKFYENASVIPDWENQTRISDKAKEIIAFSFVGVLGIQFSQLMAIGKEDYSDNKLRKYVEKCIQIIKRSLDLINFALLSKLWDILHESNIKISKENKKLLLPFFEATFESSVKEQFELLCTLHSIFLNNKLENPIEELATISKELAIDTNLSKVCTDLEELLQNLNKGQFNLIDCYEVEEKKRLNFLDISPF